MTWIFTRTYTHTRTLPMMPGVLGVPPSPAEGVGTHPGFPPTALHSGSRFSGYQQSKGNKYQVEVSFQVRALHHHHH